MHKCNDCEYKKQCNYFVVEMVISKMKVYAFLAFTLLAAIRMTIGMWDIYKIMQVKSIKGTLFEYSRLMCM